MTYCQTNGIRWKTDNDYIWGKRWRPGGRKRNGFPRGGGGVGRGGNTTSQNLQYFFL